MANQKFYIKGYKLDPDKIRQTFSKKPDLPEATSDIYWYQPIIDYIPETAYRYVGCGLEPDGHYNLVLVLDDGNDEAALKQTNVDLPESLPKQVLQVLTTGVWESVDGPI
ncbi:hypothetical protein BU17DRAFT_86042 [Hysterangium stoloniferum]|nr:hypothetical protein BU17DRAFT_86042 [Hysterangium stoloniferum]